MGEVSRARDTRLDRSVAIKFSAATFSDRFEREARAVAALNHTHICTLYDVGPNYLVMELVEGQPLKGPLPLDRVLQFASQILSALDAAHRKGITHRDLKPDNILVTKQGIKLLDFGLAKLQEGPATGVPRDTARASAESPTIAQPLTGEHTILGTLQYMSPEQAQGKPADARSDLFSFGLVLYEMLTGRRAFDGTNPSSVIAAIIERNAPSVGAVAPPALDRVLQKCLAKEPGERWQAARDIRHALDLIEEAPDAAASTGRGLKTLAIASLAGFVAASAFAIATYVKRPQEPPVSPRVSFNLTPPAGTEFQFSPTGGGAAISPDGRSVALVAVANGTPRLWIRTLDSPSARELRDTEGARLPFWSPDNRSIGFFANSKLRRIGVSDGVAVDLAPAPDPRGGTWSADGTIVFSPTLSSALQRVSASGGTPSPLTTFAPGDNSHRWPRFLPDGRSLLYYVTGQKPGAFLTTLDQPGTTTQVAQGALSEVLYFHSPARNAGYLLWVAQDKLFAQRFDPASRQLSGSPVAIPDIEDIASSLASNRGSVSVSNDGTLLYGTGGTRFRLAWFGTDGALLGHVGDVAQYIGLRLSPSGGDALVSIREAESGDLWRIDLASGARSRITSGGSGWYATWSPDGGQVAFTALNGVDVRAGNARGAGQTETLWRYGARLFPGDWSRNGQLLAFSAARTDAANDVFVLNLQGERMLRRVLESPFTELHPQFSPDGRWLAFTSDEAGREDVYVQSYPDARTRRLVSSGG